MKFLLLSFILLISIQSRSQQVYKTFFNKTGAVSDSTSATTYSLSVLNKDSLWVSKEYDIHDNLMMAGTFIDKKLSIGHGIFRFYAKSKIEINEEGDTLARDTSVFLREEGVIENGNKTGQWSRYFSDKTVSSIKNFTDGLMNGPSVEYTNTGRVFLKGNYLNDKAEGEWDMFNNREEMSSKTFYKGGKLIESVKIPSSYAPLTFPLNFNDYLKKNLSKSLIHDLRYKRTRISLTITEEGKMTKIEVHVSRKNLAEYAGEPIEEIISEERRLELITEIKQIVLNCPLPWKPAYNKISNQPTEEAVMIFLTSINSSLIIDHVQYLK